MTSSHRVIQTLATKVNFQVTPELELFAKKLIDETLAQVDERVYGRGENSWYYDDDKKWIKLHFGYGKIGT